jgi:hypothetical protein
VNISRPPVEAESMAKLQSDISITKEGKQSQARYYFYVKVKKKKVKLSLYQAMEAHRVVRR